VGTAEVRLPNLLLLLLAWIAVPASARVDTATFPGLAFQQHPGAQLPLDAKLMDAAGHPATLRSALAGRPSVIVLEYLRCQNLCSLVLTGAVRAISGAGLVPGRDVDLVAISIDPRETSADAAAAQAMYVKRFPNPATAATGARFFTAPPDQVRAIASAIGFPYRYDDSTRQFAHPAGFVITTPDGRISRYVLGLYPPPALLKRAVAEASSDKVEPAAHPLLLLCFGYDPDEGTAAALAMRLVRWTSAALVLACAGFIGLLSLRRRAA
jgi:protein SCO1/2